MTVPEPGTQRPSQKVRSTCSETSRSLPVARSTATSPCEVKIGCAPLGLLISTEWPSGLKTGPVAKPDPTTRVVPVATSTTRIRTGKPPL